MLPENFSLVKEKNIFFVVNCVLAFFYFHGDIQLTKKSLMLEQLSCVISSFPHLKYIQVSHLDRKSYLLCMFLHYEDPFVSTQSCQL